ARAGVRHDRTDQGPVRGSGRVAPRLRERSGPADHGRRPGLCEPSGGLGADGDRLRVAGTRPVHHDLAPQRLHERGPRGQDRCRVHLHRPEPAVRPPVSAGGSARPMTPAGAATPLPGWRAWLLAETPASRTQARLGQTYVSWLVFRRNPLAMAGLAILIALLLIAVFVPFLTHRSPVTQDLGHRLRPPSAEYWFGTDEL